MAKSRELVCVYSPPTLYFLDSFRFLGSFLALVMRPGFPRHSTRQIHDLYSKPLVRPPYSPLKSPFFRSGWVWKNLSLVSVFFFFPCFLLFSCGGQTAHWLHGYYTRIGRREALLVLEYLFRLYSPLWWGEMRGTRGMIGMFSTPDVYASMEGGGRFIHVRTGVDCILD